MFSPRFGVKDSIDTILFYYPKKRKERTFSPSFGVKDSVTPKKMSG